jgi:hypothetical protein
MLSITYVSSASELLDESRLIEMLATIRPKNEALGVTGMLLYSGGNIIQAIEGPDDVVDELYATIEADPRHRGVLQLLRDPVEERAFPDWSMGFQRLTDRELEVEGFSPYLRERIQPGSETSTDSAHRLLDTFRQSMR